MAHGDDEVGADEQLDLSELDHLLGLGVARRLEHDEQHVVVDLELGPLVRRDRVLDRELVEQELAPHGAELVLGRLVEPDPGEGVLGPARVGMRRRADTPGAPQAFLVHRAVDDHDRGIIAPTAAAGRSSSARLVLTAEPASGMLQLMEAGVSSARRVVAKTLQTRHSALRAARHSTALGRGARRAQGRHDPLRRPRRLDRRRPSIATPRTCATILSAYYARLRSELERYGGTVEKFIGDAVMAVFGAPVAHEDDPERAVRAALAIRDALAESEVDVRIAVHTGEALVSRGAQPAAGEAMVAGDVVNTAARLQTAAPVNGVLVGETTYRATSAPIEYRERRRGRGEGEVRAGAGVGGGRGEGAVRRRRRARAARRARRSRRRGRTLAGALARVRREREPQLVTLVGVPGIGKSRLVAELLAVVEAQPDLITWRQGRCLPYGEGVSFWALGEMAKAQAGMLETDSADGGRGEARGGGRHVGAGGDEAEWVLAHMRRWSAWAVRASADDRRSEAFAAWRRFFEGLAEQRPAVLVFEDLHWADDGLLDFVDHLADWARRRAAARGRTARPELLERRPGWGGGKANAATVSLSPLSDVETARLLGLLLEQAVLDAEVQAELLARAGGNPLYAEEYVAHAARRALLGRAPARDRAGHHRRPARRAAARRRSCCPGRGGDRQGLLARRPGCARRRRAVGGRGATARPRAQGVRPPRAAQLGRRRGRVRVQAPARPRRRVRADPAGRPGARSTGWPPSGSSRSAATASRIVPRCSRYHYGAALEFARASGQETPALEEPPARHSATPAIERSRSRRSGCRPVLLPGARLVAGGGRRLADAGPSSTPKRTLQSGRAAISRSFGGRSIGCWRRGHRPRRRGRGAARGVATGSQGEAIRPSRGWTQARGLVADRPASASKTNVYARELAVPDAREPDRESVEVGRESLALARELGLPRAAGPRAEQHRHGARERRRPRGLRGPRARRSRSPSRSTRRRRYARSANRRRSWASRRLARATSSTSRWSSSRQRLGISGFALWCGSSSRCSTAGPARGTRAGARRSLPRHVDEAHYMEPMARQVRAEIMLGRGDTERGLAESERALAFARSAKDPQVLYPTLAVAHAALAVPGRRLRRASCRRAASRSWPNGSSRRTSGRSTDVRPRRSRPLLDAPRCLRALPRRRAGVTPRPRTRPVTGWRRRTSSARWATDATRRIARLRAADWRARREQIAGARLLPWSRRVRVRPARRGAASGKRLSLRRAASAARSGGGSQARCDEGAYRGHGLLSRCVGLVSAVSGTECLQGETVAARCRCIHNRTSERPPSPRPKNGMRRPRGRRGENGRLEHGPVPDTDRAHRRRGQSRLRITALR